MSRNSFVTATGPMIGRKVLIPIDIMNDPHSRYGQIGEIIKDDQGAYTVKFPDGGTGVYEFDMVSFDIPANEGRGDKTSVNVRTFQFTHEEVELITRALGIAEVQFSNIRKQYIENLVNVRGVDSQALTAEEVSTVFERECQFGNLCYSIKQGEKDV